MGQPRRITLCARRSWVYTPNSAVAASSDNSGDGTLGRIALKQVRVSRQELEARQTGQPAAQSASNTPRPKGKANPMNRLVPYLDLFCRLDDDELSRLARVPTSVVGSLRSQVDEISAALDEYADLLPRLRDEELIRLTGASAKTVQFWRLCQPRPEPTVESKPKASDSQTAGVAAPPDPSDSVVGAVDEQIGSDEPGVALEQAQQDSGLHDISGEPFPGNDTPAAAKHGEDDFDAAFDDITTLGDDDLEVTRDDYF